MKHTPKIKRQVCLLAGLVFLLSTCGGQKKTTSRRHASSREESAFQEARLSDIPVLLGAQRIENKNNVTVQSGQKALLFSSNLSQDEVRNFYEQEMERMGWRQVGWFTGKEDFLMFEKPHNNALVVLRARGNKNRATRITVLVGQKG